MKSIDLSLKENGYKIVIGNNILSKLGPRLKSLNIGKDAIIITNPAIQRLHGKKLLAGLKKSGLSAKVFEVPAGEKSKSAQYAFRLIEKIAKYDVFKKPFIIAFGGGVVGDLAGYVASAYKRGIPFVQVPTTLLAQIDSSIGGKVAIDLPSGKNLVGAFYQPKVVWSDVSVLKTLDKRQIRNGLAEAVKYGVIYDRYFFDFIAKNVQKLLNYEERPLAKVVSRSSEIKRDVVVADEKETLGIRTILNFGHTIGHAIEAAAQYNTFHHGEAVALGMRMAADISHEMEIIHWRDVEILNDVLTEIGLPTKIKKCKMPSILKIMQRDKKFISGKNRFVLPKEIGSVKVKEGIPLDIIKKVIKAYL